MHKFADKVVLVTGAGAGIGFGLCQAFAERGAFVALNDIDPELAQSAAEKINGDVGRSAVTPYGFDVADVASIRQAVAKIVEQHGRLDITIANAGLTNYGGFLSYEPEAFDRLMQVNLRGSYFTAQAAARVMIDKQIHGRILLMSSVTGVQAYENLGAYGITKAGIRMMAKSLAVELGRYGVTVNAICPGATVTERTLLDDPNYAENWSAVNPTGQVSHVKDIVGAAVFLASSAASQITGQTIVIDGGWTLISPIPDETPDLPEYSSELR